MPEFWFAHELERVQWVGTLGFARALASASASHHAGGPRPIVNPMNLSEIDASLSSFLRLHERVSLKVGMYGAMPVGSANIVGVTRIIASSGVSVSVRGLELSAELQVPLVGAPFLARGVLQVGYRFELVRRRGKQLVSHPASHAGHSHGGAGS